MSHSADNECADCGAHIADPHSPECPACDDPDNLTDVHADGCGGDATDGD